MLIVTTLLRGFHLAALCVLLGASLSRVWLSPMLRVRHLTRWSVCVAMLCGCLWLIGESVIIASPDTMPEAIQAVGIVASATRFGHVIAPRLVMLAMAWLFADRLPPWVVLAGAAIALASQPLVGHAGAAGSLPQIAAEALHLLAAGAWLGALVPLLIGVSRLPPTAAATALARFSPIGMTAVAVIAITAVTQGLTLIGSTPALVGTRYGLLALAKLALFTGLLGCAAYNRFVLTDRLAEDEPGAGARLRVSIGAEIALGGAVLLVAAWLGSTPPGAHEQPVWPFPWQLDPDALALRPNREAVALGLGITGLAVAVLAASLIWRRFRLAAVGLLAATLAWRIAALVPLLTEAYPTSFFTSPTGFATGSILRGAALFQDNCAACHGPLGRGDGPAAALLPVRPANLAEGHVLSHSDGELFWRLRSGFQATDGRVLMPAFGDLLTDEQRWQLIDDIRANAVGQSLPGSGVLPYPLPLPSFAITCAGMQADRPEDLRGKAVHVIAGADTNSPVLTAAGSVPVVRLQLTQGEGPDPSTGCVSRSADAWPTFAILAGVAPDRLAGTQFLIDPAGLIRRIWRPNQAGPTGDATALLAAVRDICENPATPVFGEVHEHHH